MNYLQLPVEILPYLKRLSGVQVAIWADAWTWQQNGKQCRRSNGQLGEMFGVSGRSASEAVANLRKIGLVDVVVDAGGRAVVARFPHPAQVPPPGSTSTPRSNLHPPVEVPGASGSSSTHPPVEVPPPTRSKFHQIEKNKEKVKEKVKEKEQEVVLPWSTDSFKQVWMEWLEYKRVQHKFQYKRAQDQQTALHQLQKISNGDEAVAIHVIAESISNGWKGLFASSAKSVMGSRSGTGSYFRTSGKYEHPADVLTDSDIWG